VLQPAEAPWQPAEAAGQGQGLQLSHPLAVLTRTSQQNALREGCTKKITLAGGYGQMHEHRKPAVIRFRKV